MDSSTSHLSQYLPVSLIPCFPCVSLILHSLLTTPMSSIPNLFSSPSALSGQRNGTFPVVPLLLAFMHLISVPCVPLLSLLIKSQLVAQNK